jgi:hypothetical protein
MRSISLFTTKDTKGHKGMQKKIFVNLCVPLCALWFMFFLVACQPTASAIPASPANTAVAASVTPSPKIVVAVTDSTGVAYAPRISPTATNIPSTATPIPPTDTPSPTFTPTPRGALTWGQQQLLYEASQRYLADTTDKANQIIRQQIDYLPGNVEDVSLVCGPLSAILLREASVLPPDTDLHAFWLLDPRTRPNQITLETYFPKDRFAWYHFDTPMDQFDYNAFPLLPGDFLYLYPGRNGTFEHMIAITKVDDAGRAYTVSNLNTTEGFVIRELMLYDPTQPGIGQIYDWANFELNKWLGLTGGAGFDLWRLAKP